MIRKVALAACVSASFALLNLAAAPANANPVGIAFKYTTNVNLYAKPTGMLITGRCNRYATAFASARSKGAEVLAYFNVASRPDQYVCAMDQAFYMGNYGRVPLWPYPSYGQRQIWANTKMTDMRPGSKWILHAVDYITTLMREKKVDGVFLDIVGGRPWSSMSNWNNWSLAEKNAWTDGNIDFVRRLDARRRAINPKFIIVVNNMWYRNDTTRPVAGEQYVDGITLESANWNSAFYQAQVRRKFSNLGHRRVLVFDDYNAAKWNSVPGVTHVSNQDDSQYTYPRAPVVGFKPLYDRR